MKIIQKIIRRLKIWQLDRKNREGMFCWEGPCDMEQIMCCYYCAIRDKCPDACDRYDECGRCEKE